MESDARVVGSYSFVSNAVDQTAAKDVDRDSIYLMTRQDVCIVARVLLTVGAVLMAKTVHYASLDTVFYLNLYVCHVDSCFLTANHVFPKNNAYNAYKDGS